MRAQQLRVSRFLRVSCSSSKVRAAGALYWCCLLVHVLSKDARQHTPQPTSRGPFHPRLCRGSPALVAVADRTPPHSSIGHVRRKPSAAAAAVAVAHAERRSATTAAAAHAERRSASTAPCPATIRPELLRQVQQQPCLMLKWSCACSSFHHIAELLSLIELGNRGTFLSGSRYFV